MIKRVPDRSMSDGDKAGVMAGIILSMVGAAVLFSIAMILYSFYMEHFYQEI